MEACQRASPILGVGCKLVARDLVVMIVVRVRVASTKYTEAAGGDSKGDEDKGVCIYRRWVRIV